MVKIKEKLVSYKIQTNTFIWFNAESFKPVMSNTFRQAPICRPCFFVAEGYNKTKNQDIGKVTSYKDD